MNSTFAFPVADLELPVPAPNEDVCDPEAV
jgi:hypothetical protein